MTTMNKAMITAGVWTLMQSGLQVVLTIMAISQHFCAIDFLKNIPLLIYVKILYFHNPGGCGSRINIGEAIDSLAPQAFVLLTQEPASALRTLILNSVLLGLGLLWVVASVILIMAGANDVSRKATRWPWITVTVSQCAVDLVAIVTYANDTFHTKTLTDIISFVGGTVSGVGNVELNTAWASWAMVLLYSRFIFIFITNVIFLIMMVINYNINRETFTSTAVQVEAQVHPSPVSVEELSERSSIDDLNKTYDVQVQGIPRAGLSQSFRRMKQYILQRSVQRRIQFSASSSPERHSGQTISADAGNDKKRTVNFLNANKLTVPQMSGETCVMDTSFTFSPGPSTQTMPQENTTISDARGQLPWAYIPSSHPMRDQLPPDEDLPPVPLPDYTAIGPSLRKASVHRAASLNSLTQKKASTSNRLFKRSRLASTGWHQLSYNTD